MVVKNNTVKKCAIDKLKNDFENLYSKYKFLCSVDGYLWDFADDDFEAFSLNFLFFLKSINGDFIAIINAFDDLAGD